VPEPLVDFRVDPAAYRHWDVAIDAPVATVTLGVDPHGGLRDDYELKLNSYDLSVDVELHDIAQRLRFEHPEVHAVVVTGGLDRVFCAGANIQMLAGASHHHKVNFCKFTNETRNAIDDAQAQSGQAWIAAINGTAAGGGYELALACEEIILVDDRSSAVSLPEVPLLGVLPGTGGLTRVVDKRHVRRDLADVFATRAEGVKGQQAVDWRLVDAVAPPSRFAELVAERARALAARSDRPTTAPAVILGPLSRSVDEAGIHYEHLDVQVDREARTAAFVLTGPGQPAPATAGEAVAQGDQFWPLALCRELDDAILHLRFNETELGTWTFRTTGDAERVQSYDALLASSPDHWFLREVRSFWARTLKRIDVSARTLLALIEPGSCFVGSLAELALAADRSYMLDGTWEGEDVDTTGAATMLLNEANGGWYPMPNGLSRLATRFWGRPQELEAARSQQGKELLASDALQLGLVTFAPDDLDWEDEVRLAVEERASFSPDALTGLEASCRFPGPETMETKIFARLSAWQNWIFQRPNAVGPEGALQRYGTGARPAFDRRRV